MGRTWDLTEFFETAEKEHTSLAAVTRNLRLALKRHAAKDDLVCPAPNLYERRDTWEGLKPDEKAIHTIRGLAALHPKWAFCRTSAALILGLRVPYSCTNTVHVLASGGRSNPLREVKPPLMPADGAPDVAFHQRTTPSRDRAEPFELIKTDGVRTTPLDETVLDCLQTLRLTESLVIADSYLARARKDSSYLVGLLRQRRTGCRGIDQAIRSASYADSRSESGGESFARARIIELGYEVPDLQVEFHDQLTGTKIRCDFLWHLPSGAKVAEEFDGIAKYIEPDMAQGREAAEILVQQNMRDTRLQLHVDRVVHFTDRVVKNDWQFSTLLDAYGIPYRS